MLKLLNGIPDVVGVVIEIFVPVSNVEGFTGLK